MVSWKKQALSRLKKEQKAKEKESKELNKGKHYCGDCGNAEWDFTFRNRSIDGLPICVKCPLHEYKKVRSEQACHSWKPKSDEDLIITPERQLNVHKESYTWI